MKEFDIITHIRLKRIRTGSTIDWKVFADGGIPIDLVDDYVAKMHVICVDDL